MITIAVCFSYCMICLVLGALGGMIFVALLDWWHDKEMNRLYREAGLKWKS